MYYRTTAQGGRLTPAFSGYTPQVKFALSEMQTSGQQKFLNEEITYPGDIINAEISILPKDFFKAKLNVEDNFEFREGDRITGTGKILTILNKELLAI